MEEARTQIARGINIDWNQHLGGRPGCLTALMHAVLEGRTAMVKDLIRAGASLDMTEAVNISTFGDTALIMAVEHGHVEMVRDLIDGGAYH